jgi:hypothetical protein
VYIWARAYDNGLSQGYALDKTSTATMRIYTDAPVGAKQRAEGLGHAAGIQWTLTPDAVRVTFVHDCPAAIRLMGLNGTVAYGMTAGGAGRYDIPRRGLGRGSYVLQVTQDDTTLRYRLPLVTPH